MPNRRVPLQCPTAKYPCSAQLLLAKLVGALESALRCTSSAVGSCTRSGTLRSVLALQTALSRDRRGSLPSAMTMLSLPIAAPSGQCDCAALASPANGLIHPACVLVGPGLAGRLDRALLASSSPGSVGDARHQVHCHREACLHALLQQVWQSGIRVLAPGCKCLEKPEAKGLAICDLPAGLVIARGVQAAVPDLCDV